MFTKQLSQISSHLLFTFCQPYDQEAAKELANFEIDKTINMAGFITDNGQSTVFELQTAVTLEEDSLGIINYILYTKHSSNDWLRIDK
jgi:hypothetical protein